MYTTYVIHHILYCISFYYILLKLLYHTPYTIYDTQFYITYYIFCVCTYTGYKIDPFNSPLETLKTNAVTSFPSDLYFIVRTVQMLVCVIIIRIYCVYVILYILAYLVIYT